MDYGGRNFNLMHAVGFMPRVLTTCSRDMVSIPRDKLEGIPMDLLLSVDRAPLGFAFGITPQVSWTATQRKWIYAIPGSELAAGGW